MFKQISKKIALVTNVLVFLQVAMIGIFASPTVVSAGMIEANTDKVVSIELVDNDTMEVTTLTDGSTLNLSILPEDMSLRAVADPVEVNGSVSFKFDNLDNDSTYVKHVNIPPYEIDDAFLDELFTVGEHKVTVSPFDLEYGKGNQGTSLSVNFEVINKPVVLDDYQMAYMVNDAIVVANPEITIPVKYNVAMDQTVAPVAVVTPDVTTTASLVADKSKWVSDTEYNFVYALTDANVEVPLVNITVSGAQDKLGNVQIPFTYSGMISIDTKNPVVTMTTNPSVVNDASKYTSVIFTADSEIVLNSLNVVLTQKDNPIAQVLLPDHPQKDPKVLVVPIEIPFSGKEPIQVKASFKDVNGNVTEVAETLTPDVSAPVVVTGLSTDINPDGSVTLKWVNPNPDADYDKIVIYRDGVEYYVLEKGVIVFNDFGTETGKTYVYKVALLDAAGNTTFTDEAEANVPVAKIAAVASDTFVPVTVPAEISQDQPEVKSETTEERGEETETKKSSLPRWGLITLFVLAAIGGYLYLSENRKEVKKVNKSKVKTTSKKK